MTTNGTLIDGERAKWMAEHKIKYLLSLDGTKEDHDRYRKFPDGRSSYDLIMKRLPLMKSYQPWIETKMSVTPESALYLRNNIYELWKNGINQFIIGYAHGMNWADEGLLDYERGMLDVCELYMEMKYNKEHFRITTFEKETICDVKEVPFGCGADGDDFVSIHWETCMDVLKCVPLWERVKPFGNVFQWFSKIHNRYHCLNGSINPRQKCQTCYCSKICAGGCPAVNFADTGSVYEVADVSCKLGLILRRIEDYLRHRNDKVFNTAWSNLFQKKCLKQGFPIV